MFCNGDFSAKATLIGLDAACTSLPSSKHHDTLPDGGDNYTFASKSCGDLHQKRYYHAGGIHWGFGTDEYYSESEGSVYFPGLDNDGDSHDVDEDCDDSHNTVWDNCTIFHVP